MSNSRMKEKCYGITYPCPVFLQKDWCWKLWAKVMCPKGWHLLDEVMSLNNHYLFCDACEISIPLAGEKDDLES